MVLSVVVLLYHRSGILVLPVVDLEISIVSWNAVVVVVKPFPHIYDLYVRLLVVETLLFVSSNYYRIFFHESKRCQSWYGPMRRPLLSNTPHRFYLSETFRKV